MHQASINTQLIQPCHQPSPSIPMRLHHSITASRGSWLRTPVQNWQRCDAKPAPAQPTLTRRLPTRWTRRHSIHPSPTFQTRVRERWRVGAPPNPPVHPTPHLARGPCSPCPASAATEWVRCAWRAGRRARSTASAADDLLNRSSSLADPLTTSPHPAPQLAQVHRASAPQIARGPCPPPSFHVCRYSVLLRFSISVPSPLCPHLFTFPLPSSGAPLPVLPVKSVAMLLATLVTSLLALGVSAEPHRRSEANKAHARRALAAKHEDRSLWKRFSGQATFYDTSVGQLACGA